uniref:Uncharacterized protein n=1 Tax=Corethron hystrix TaxID=216773 RepID=A0A7S1B9S6_9STRA|mmetsp:Transcript_18690/g.42693  ORF Transcript_18690/g.42693 Transcript_18690/m.42693 type:complete len:198 (+) Transcript_18690:92-685(+)
MKIVLSNSLVVVVFSLFLNIVLANEHTKQVTIGKDSVNIVTSSDVSVVNQNIAHARNDKRCKIGRETKICVNKKCTCVCIPGDNEVRKCKDLTTFTKCKCKKCSKGKRKFCTDKEGCICMKVKKCKANYQLGCAKNAKTPKDCKCYPSHCDKPGVLLCKRKEPNVCHCRTPEPSASPKNKSSSPSPSSSKIFVESFL